MVGGAWEGQLVQVEPGRGGVDGRWSLGGASGPDGRWSLGGVGWMVGGAWEGQLVLIPHSVQLVHGQVMLFRYTV